MFIGSFTFAETIKNVGLNSSRGERGELTRFKVTSFSLIINNLNKGNIWKS